MLRSRFGSLPGAFNACLIPVEKNDGTKKKGVPGLKGLTATFSRKFNEVYSCSVSETNQATNFGNDHNLESNVFYFLYISGFFRSNLIKGRRQLNFLSCGMK